MKKGLLTMLALLSMGSSAFAQDYSDYSGPDATVVAARKGVLRVEVAASKSYRDLQFDLKLPDGLTLEPDWVPDETNVKSAATGHVIAYQPQSDGNVRFVIYDGENGNTFSSEGGVLIEIPVSADADFEGGPAHVTGVIASLNDEKATSAGQSAFDIIINLGLLGDVNEDGDVDVQDIVCVISDIQHDTPAVFNRGAADIDDEGNIDVQDIVGIVSIIQDKNPSTSAKEFDDEEIGPDPD